MATHQFQTNIPELIRKLGMNLYNDPIVAIRELVQNANDACILAEGLLGNQRGRIDLIVDHRKGQLEVIDTGIGMTSEDMQKFLSTIASSRKSELRQQLEDAHFEPAKGIAGQFGIGFLSTFIVADEVVVESRHQRESGPGSIWRSSGDGNYSIIPSGENLPKGTRIILKLKPSPKGSLTPAAISEALLNYCPYVRTHYHVNKSSLPVNHDLAPWMDQSNPGLGESYTQSSFNMRPLVGFYFDHKGAVTVGDTEVTGLRISGYLAIPDRHLWNEENIRIYTSGLYVGEMKEGLPSWARFVVGGVECPDLDLTLGRDNVMNNPTWAAVRKVISDALTRSIVADLKDTRSRLRQRWDNVFRVHREEIMRAAVENARTGDGEFFAAVKDIIPFSIGAMSLSIIQAIEQGKCLEKNGQKYLFYHSTGFRHQESAGVQETLMYDEAGMHFIIARNYYDRDFIQQYSKDKSRVQLVPVEDGLEHLISFDSTNPESARITTDTYLSLGINAKLGRFAPSELAGVILPVSGDRSRKKSDLDFSTPEGRDTLIELMTQSSNAAHRKPYTLVVNENNILVQELLGYCNRHGIDSHIKGAFNQIYFLSVLVFGDTNTTTIAQLAPTLSSLVLGFIRRSADQEGELERIRSMLSESQEKYDSIRSLVETTKTEAADPRTVFVGYGYDPKTEKLGAAFIKMLRSRGVNVIDGKVDRVGSLSSQIIARMKKCSMFIGILTPREALGSAGEYSPSIWVVEEKGVAMALGLKVLMITDVSISKQFYGNTEGDNLRLEVGDSEAAWLEKLTDAAEIIDNSLLSGG